MKTNHLTGSQRAGRDVILGHGRGWGYGMSVVTDAIPGQRIGFIWLDRRLRHFVARRHAAVTNQLRIPSRTPSQSPKFKSRISLASIAGTASGVPDPASDAGILKES
jgi:hypothetical protein